MPTVYLRQEWVQGGHRPGAEFEAAQASTFPFLVLISISSLRTRLLPNTIRVLKTYQIWDGFCGLAKPNEGRTNLRQPPVADDLSEVRSSETSNVRSADLRRLRMRLCSATLTGMKQRQNGKDSQR